MKKKLVFIVLLLSAMLVFAQATEAEPIEEITAVVENSTEPTESTDTTDVATLAVFEKSSAGCGVGVGYAPHFMFELYQGGTTATMVSNGFEISAIVVERANFYVRQGFCGRYGFFFPNSITVSSNGNNSKVSTSGMKMFLMDMKLGLYSYVIKNKFYGDFGLNLYKLCVSDTRTPINVGMYINLGKDINISKNFILALNVSSSMSLGWLFDNDKIPTFTMIPMIEVKYIF